MRAVVIGKSGQLARCLAEGAPAGVELTCLDRRALDLTNASADFAVLQSLRPDVIINAAAYTAVDKAESDREAAFALNADGPSRLAAFSAARGIPLIHVSTDYVFDGTVSRPYVEDDAPAPCNIYGQSKLEGERAIIRSQPEHLILRTSWLFSAHGNNFLKTMLRLASERGRIRIVNDQFGCPTSAHELAIGIWQIAGRACDRGAFRQWGIYHYAGAGATNWADFAQAILASPEARLAHVPPMDRVSTQDYPTPAIRPRNSVLNCTKFESNFDIHTKPWEAAIADVVARLRARVQA